jgi:hypothetical protein
LNGPINFSELTKKYRVITDAGKRLEDELILLEPNSNCIEFDYLIDELVSLFDIYLPYPNARESHEFGEEKLRDLVQNIFIKMKEDFSENSNENL